MTWRMARGADAVEASETKPDRGLWAVTPTFPPAPTVAISRISLTSDPTPSPLPCPSCPHSSARRRTSGTRFTVRPSSRSRDTPGREWGTGVGEQGLSGKAQRRSLASLKPRPSALQETRCKRLALPQPPHGLCPPIEHTDALRDQVSAGLGPSPRCRWRRGRGASRLGSRQLREGLRDAHGPAWLLSAELAQSSQEHLQHTVKYGGRRRLPSPSEMQAFLVLGVRAGWCSGTPCGWQELGPLSTGGLTLRLP